MPDQSNLTRDSSDEGIMLAVLTSVENNQKVTQRSLAKELGIAVGLANAYVKRCVQKGFIKISQVPPRRYTYYLTPKGFSEKSRLTVEYLQVSFNFFRSACSQLNDLFALCAARGLNRVALVGTGELGEIAFLCAQQHSITVVGFIDPLRAGRQVHDLPVVGDPAELVDAEAFILTDVKNPQGTFDGLVGKLPAGRLFAPRLLNISVRSIEPVE